MILKNFNLNLFKFLLPFAIIMYGVYLRTYFLLEVPSFGLDACFLIGNLEKNFIELFKPLDNVQVAPPLFLIISKFFYNLSSQTENLMTKDFILLLLPYTASILSLPLFYILVNKMFSNFYFNCVCLFLYAIDPIAINYAVEFKQYSFETMIALILLLMFYSIIFKKIEPVKLVFCSLFIAISPWFSISALFIILSCFSILFFDLIKNKFLERKNFLILLTPFIVSMIIYYFFYYIPIKQNIYESMHSFWKFIDPSFLTCKNFFSLFSRKISLFNFSSVYYVNIFILLIFNILIMIWNKRYKEFLFLFFPIVFVIIASGLEYYPFEARLILFILPLFIMLSSQYIILLKEKIITSIFVLSFISFGIYVNLKSDKDTFLYHSFDTREVINILISKNPELKNVISDKNVYPYYIKKEPLFKDEMNYSVEDSMINKFLPTLPPDTYWIFIPAPNDYYLSHLKSVLEQNSFEIVEKYRNGKEYNYSMLLKINKK